MRGIVKEFPGVKLEGALQLRLVARQGETLLSGIELIAEQLDPGKIFSLERERAGHQLILPEKR